MPEISITLTNLSGGGLNVGDKVDNWAGAAKFDHAALVTAGRSRSDALDFWLYHTTAGSVDFIGVVGANTTTCYVTFNVAVALTPPNTDTRYRLVFGDLGAQVSRALGPDGPVTVYDSVSASTVPALTLPNPGFPLAETRIYDVRALPYPDSIVTRRARLNGNARRRITARWTSVSPEDWYEVRAFVRAQKGGSGSFTAPAWMNGGSGTFSVEPESVTLSQASRSAFTAEASFLECPV